jgi:heme exporter protein D
MVVSVTQNDHQHHPVLVQAPVRALDPDGVAVIGSGTVAFAIGVVVCWWFQDFLAATGRGWYLAVAISGTVLGVIGLAIGLSRRHRRVRREPEELEESSEQQLEP